MSSLYVIVDSPEIWAPYYTTEQVITAKDYLMNIGVWEPSSQVYNLCSDYSYRSPGYYCSLLAEARKHKVLPSVRTLNELSGGAAMELGTDLLRRLRQFLTTHVPPEVMSFRSKIFFGLTRIPALERLAKKIFELYPAPLLEVEFERGTGWYVTNVRPVALAELDEAGQDEFAAALDNFSKKIWRQPRRDRPARFDLAILVDPEEKMPPSNRAALQLFIKNAKQLDIDADLITAKDETRLLEYDALFIRQTTAINHITLRLAQRAARSNMPVIDDPDSIIRCTNKVFLHELLSANKVRVPNALMIFADSVPAYEAVREELGNPLVLKIPDGSFSFGVTRVGTAEDFATAIDGLLAQSSVIVAQEFVPTSFDWRIGVLAGRAIFACKYFMVRGHWQIYSHEALHSKSGGYEAVAVHRVPAQVTRLALKAAGLIGNGLYGVDVKETDSGPVVIEVNDNPSIDRGVEDALLGEDLYRTIMAEFLNRLYSRA